VALNTRVKPHALPQRHILRAITTKRLRAVLFLFSSHRPSSILLTPKAKDTLRLPLLLLSRQPTDSRFAREPTAADLPGSFLHLSALQHPRSLTPGIFQTCLPTNLPLACRLSTRLSCPASPPLHPSLTRKSLSGTQNTTLRSLTSPRLL
jgi:hypothetical protein